MGRVDLGVGLAMLVAGGVNAWAVGAEVAAGVAAGDVPAGQRLQVAAQ